MRFNWVEEQEFSEIYMIHFHTEIRVCALEQRLTLRILCLTQSNHLSRRFSKPSLLFRGFLAVLLLHGLQDVVEDVAILVTNYRLNKLWHFSTV